MATITDINTCVLKSPEYPHGGWVLVRVRTEDGVEGLKAAKACNFDLIT